MLIDVVCKNLFLNKNFRYISKSYFARALVVTISTVKPVRNLVEDCAARHYLVAIWYVLFWNRVYIVLLK